MSEGGGEKSFAPTAKRLRDAALRGDVLRSREAATAVSILAGAAYLKFAGPWLFDRMAGAVRLGLTFDRRSLTEFDPGGTLLACLLLALPPILALALPVLALVLASQIGLGEGRFLAANLQPKASRIDPLNGLKRMFGPDGLIETAKGIAKVLLLGGIAWFHLTPRLPRLLALGRAGLGDDLAWAWQALVSLVLALAVGLAVIALVDVPTQWIRRRHRLLMTLQEVRDEHKEAEGSPENKAAIRRRQRQLAQAGLQHAMREAQFVLTNPTHFSVAMAYDPGKAAAPVVIAKGRGEKALAMRELARELGLPALEYPALARSVYFTTRERQVIREELYAAVASVLAFVLSLKRGEARPRPVVDIPLDLRFDTEGRKDRAAGT